MCLPRRGCTVGQASAALLDIQPIVSDSHNSRLLGRFLFKKSLYASDVLALAGRALVLESNDVFVVGTSLVGIGCRFLQDDVFGMNGDRHLWGKFSIMAFLQWEKTYFQERRIGAIGFVSCSYSLELSKELFGELDCRNLQRSLRTTTYTPKTTSQNLAHNPFTVLCIQRRASAQMIRKDLAFQQTEADETSTKMRVVPPRLAITSL